MSTGAGKTATFSKIVRDHKGPACIIAHRQELVGQISLALAREEVRHNIVGPNPVVQTACNQQKTELGKSYYSTQSQVAVAGVQTLIRRRDSLARWAKSVTLWVLDECHHLAEGTQWHKAVEMFPNAKGLGVTATPVRTDGKPLNTALDAIVEGPPMKWLIANGYLSPYKVYVPPNNIDFESIKVSNSTGDYTMPSLTREVRKSRIVGDIVSHYRKYAHGKLGVTFATDVDTAHDIAAQYNAEGVPALAISANNTDAERVKALRDFKDRRLLQIVNCDILGEGFDCPGIEVVSFGRPTQSYGLHCQQFGRALRPLPGKTHAIVLDHVGNVIRHGVPDLPKVWSLEGSRGGNRNINGEIPMTSCPECLAAYMRTEKQCPYCGYKPEPASRSQPRQVDGDLTELDPSVLDQMHRDAEAAIAPDGDYYEWLCQRGVPQHGRNQHTARHATNRVYQEALRDTIAQWAGYRRAWGRSDSQSYREFFFKFGVDVLTAQTLKAKESSELASRVEKDYKCT